MWERVADRGVNSQRGPGPLIIAHRGASALELENTLPAFRRAQDDGADGVELDVQRCASGELVVFHDVDLMRLAGHPGKITRMTLGVLRSLRLTGGGAIPTLDEVLDGLDPAALLNVEMKLTAEETGLPLADTMIDWFRRRNPGRRVLVSSFHPLALARFQRGQPAVRCGLLFGADQARWLREGWTRHGLRPYAVHPEHRLLTAPNLKRWRAEGYAIHTWTTDGDDAVAAARLGVDALITNDPAETRRRLCAEGLLPG